MGMGADDLGMQCGGWTIAWQGQLGAVTHGGTTLLAAIKQTVSPDTQVTFSPDGQNLKAADAIIVVVGEKPYAEMKGDRKDLDLGTKNENLIKLAKASGKPVVTVLYSGRPLVWGEGLTDSDAVVAAWLPGTEGLGMTDVLFGDYKFRGRLSRTWPADDNHIRANDPDQQVAFKLGFGLKD
jgi:beta-glucosidase